MTKSDPYAAMRANPRVAVALPAFLQAAGERHSVHLLDLSAGGAKLNCSMDVPVGTPVTVDCGMLACPGVVRWQNEGQLGLSFDRELGPAELSALKERSQALAGRMQSRSE